jgi:hypothetical protein
MIFSESHMNQLEYGAFVCDPSCNAVACMPCVAIGDYDIQCRLASRSSGPVFTLSVASFFFPPEVQKNPLVFQWDFLMRMPLEPNYIMGTPPSLSRH